MVREPLVFAADHVEEVLRGGEETVGKLLTRLVQSGLAMAVAGNSRPAGGCEHHASHFWDLLAAHGRRQHASHGLQTGYATGFAMRLQRHAFGGGVTALRQPVAPADPLSAEARGWLGEPTDELRAAVDEKQSMLARVPSVWAGDDAAWRGVQTELAPSLALFDDVRAGLDAAGIPTTPGYLEIDEETLRATFHYASRLRARYTTIDFLEGQGALALDDAIEMTINGR